MITLESGLISFRRIIPEGMLQEPPEFTPEYNTAILRLIKQKIVPLQRSKAILHNIRHSQHSTLTHISNHHMTPHISINSLPSLLHTVPPAKLKENSDLIDRAKQYIKDHRKGRSTHIEKGELKKYIDLFQRPIQMNQRGKRDSIQFSLMELDNRERLEPLPAVSTQEEELQLNQEQRSIIYAKIRRKLNHRKIIDLAKRL